MQYGQRYVIDHITIILVYYIGALILVLQGLGQTVVKSRIRTAKWRDVVITTCYCFRVFFRGIVLTRHGKRISRIINI